MRATSLPVTRLRAIAISLAIVVCVLAGVGQAPDARSRDEKLAAANRLYGQGSEMYNKWQPGFFEGDPPLGEDRAKAALDLYREVGAVDGEVRALRLICAIERDRVRTDARGSYEELIQKHGVEGADPTTLANDYLVFAQYLYYTVKAKGAQYAEVRDMVRKTSELLDAAGASGEEALRVRAEGERTIAVTYDVEGGDAVAAERHFGNAIRYAEQLQDRRLEGRLLTDLAIYDIGHGYYLEASQKAYQAMKIGSKMLDGSWDWVRRWEDVMAVRTICQKSHKLLGAVAVRYGNIGEARRQYLLAEADCPDSGLGGARPCYEIALAEIDAKRGWRHKAALRYEALRRIMPIVGDRTVLIDFNLSYAGFLSSSSSPGDIAHAHECLRLVRQNSDDNRMWYSRLECRLQTGQLFLGECKWNLALAQFAGAADELSKTDADSPELEWRAYYGCGEAYEGMGIRSKALELYGKAIERIEDLYRRAKVTRKTANALVAKETEPYQAAFSILAASGKPEQAFAVSEQARTRLLLAALQGANAGQGNVAGTRRVEWRELEGIARETRSVVVDYVLSPNACYVIAASPGAATKCIRLKLNCKELSDKVALYSKLITARGEATTGPGVWLYDKLIGPVRQRLQTGRMVRIVPDGCLWNVPFEALVHGDRFLVETTPILYELSVSSMAALERSKRSNGAHVDASRQLAAFYRPASGIRTALTRAIHGTQGESALPYAAQEVHAACSLYPGRSTEFKDANATVPRALGALRRYRICRFATHGKCSNDEPLLSYVLLSGSENAGALDARTLAHAKISSDLIVFSGCETLGAPTAGEGVLGLTWAGLVGGAKSEIVSLWPVNDRSTATLMAAFYAGVTKSGNLATALQQAKCRMLLTTKYRHPYYWAPFVAVGREVLN